MKDYLRETPPRAEKRVKIEIDLRPHAQSIGGQLCNQGRNTILVYESDLEAIQSLVEADDSIEMQQAQVFYKRELDKHAKERAHEKDPHGQPVDPASTFGMSVPAAYWLLHKKEPGALRSLKVLERDLPPPETNEDRRVRFAAQAQSEMVSAAIADGIAKGMAAAAQLVQQRGK